MSEFKEIGWKLVGTLKKAAELFLQGAIVGLGVMLSLLKQDDQDDPDPS